MRLFKKENLGKIKNNQYLEPILFLIIFNGFIFLFAKPMGVGNMLNTIMNTAYKILLNTAFYIMAIAVIMSAFSEMLTEFGVVNLVNKLLSPLMHPIYGLPGASSLGIVLTYLTDNPAILSMAENKKFRKYFKKYQLPALTNLGTAFGMGMIISTFIIGMGAQFGVNLIIPVVIGNLGAIIGSVVSTRLMLGFTKRIFGKEEPCMDSKEIQSFEESIVKENLGNRVLKAILKGGESGVKLGLSIIPGVLIICTFIIMLTNGTADTGAYTGAAFEGIGLLPKIADKLNFIFEPLFGFSSNKCIAVPITSLGAAGAAIGLIPELFKEGMANAHDVTVFTAMCMCWSGYLSTHVSMMDTLGFKELTGKAILSHTIGGIVAGISANWIYILFIH